MAEEKNKTLRITLHVYDNEIPLTVLREDEALYREAAKVITDTMNVYAEKYRGQIGRERLLYMALINIAFQYAREARHNDTEPFHEILRKLTSEVEAALA